MKRKLRLLFEMLRAIGIIAITLSFFKIGKNLIDQYFLWFLIVLWVGVVGLSILERVEKRNKKSEL